jgi:hypothetical protein
LGGADTKAFICLAIALPDFPSSFNPLLGIWLPLFPMSVLSNTCLLSLLTIPYVVLRNLYYISRVGDLFQEFKHEPFYRKTLAFFIAYKVKRENIPNSLKISLAENTINGKRRFQFMLRIKDPTANFAQKLPEKVWITPQLPMLLYAFGGIITTLLVGDIVLWTVFQLTSLRV